MRVLIVEDEPVIALEIEAIVLDRLPSVETVVACSVRDALKIVDGAPLDLAFLDIDVTDGKTYSLALELRLKHVPFVFVSGADRGEAPDELKLERRVPKPFRPESIARELDALARKDES
ncbi:response regulator [Chenggangzhangella methanolivorans]|uniref:Response regulator n=1 Tax=Chenggangzhangella methanolivorans TaxID=1437009 RepID=A0A9E6REV5_9HYPH|nr:response regulator [Chenggangzhangella methanolivorans]QZN99930.1 response regulator [Chenggangzhangella methanolivorans]